MTLTMIASTYFAGFLTSLTPCVYPMIPLSVGYLGSRGEGLRKSVILAFVLGQILMFGLMGVMAVELGEVFGFLSESRSVRLGTGAALLVFFYFSWTSRLPGFLLKLNSAVRKESDRASSLSIPGAIFVGVLSVLVASPCSTPILGSVLVMISQAEERLLGGALMVIYGVGLSTLFLVLGLGLLKSKSLPRSGKWMEKIHKLSNILLLASGIYFIFIGFKGWLF